MTMRVLCIVVLGHIVFTHTVDLFAQNTVVSWSALDMGLASPASATTKVLSVAGQIFVGSLQSANAMIESGFLADTLLRGSVTTGINEEHLSTLPTEFRLDQNYPNPFNPSTTIRYGLPNKTAVQLTVFNTLGQSVSTLVNGEQEAGYHEVKFDGSKLASGVYFYRIQAGTFVQTKRLLLLK